MAPRLTHSIGRLCRVRDYLRSASCEAVTLDDCAAEAGLSPWHLLRSFRDEFGETPKQFLIRVRLEHARRLLALTNRSVTDVCFDVGFTSLGSFCTLFKERSGYSPREFRRRSRSWVTVPGRPSLSFIPFCYAHRFGSERWVAAPESTTVAISGE